MYLKTTLFVPVIIIIFTVIFKVVPLLYCEGGGSQGRSSTFERFFNS